MSLKDYGQARQLTLFEHGRPALQVLTSDENGCAAGVLSSLKSRWREENFLKYGADNLRPHRRRTTEMDQRASRLHPHHRPVKSP